MFKDYDKYLSTSLKVYLFVLVIIFILKVVGLDYFGLDINNPFIVKLSKLVSTNIFVNVPIYFIPLIINQYVIVSFANNDNSKKMKIYNLLTLPIYYAFEVFKIKLFGGFSFIAEIIYYFIITFLFTRKISKKLIKRYLFIVGFMILVQIISIITRTNYSVQYITNPICNIILNLDYIVMLLIVHKINFTKGDEKLCYQEVLHSSLQMKKHYSQLQRKWQENSSNFKKLNKEEKATFIIYSILSLIWNIFTLLVVLFIAKLNDTFVECVFIITSFWLSKRVFGKPFHLKSMLQCFILSNLTYYILNRITTPTGISILIPIMLGVGLSYITSKFVKKNYKPLYKGMSKEDFENTILKVVDKDSDKYKICYDFFINKNNAIYLGHKYNYTEAGIRQITSRVNNSIKALNK